MSRQEDSERAEAILSAAGISVPVGLEEAYGQGYRAICNWSADLKRQSLLPSDEPALIFDTRRLASGRG